MFNIACRKSLGLFVFMTMFCAFSVDNSFAADVEFRWAIMAADEDRMEGLDFSGGPPIVHTGTPLQIYLQHLNNCHIYLYLLDSSNDLTPLYPAESGYYNYGFPRGPKYIPPGLQSFTFVPPEGTEKIYLIATVERQFQIEKLTDEFLSHSNSIGQQKLLLSELDTLIEARQKDSKGSEKIERVERKVRTKEGIVVESFDSVEVDISESYGRKLLIDHR